MGIFLHRNVCMSYVGLTYIQSRLLHASTNPRCHKYQFELIETISTIEFIKTENALRKTSNFHALLNQGLWISDGSNFWTIHHP